MSSADRDSVIPGWVPTAPPDPSRIYLPLSRVAASHRRSPKALRQRLLAGDIAGYVEGRGGQRPRYFLDSNLAAFPPGFGPHPTAPRAQQPPDMNPRTGPLAEALVANQGLRAALAAAVESTISEATAKAERSRAAADYMAAVAASDARAVETLRHLQEAFRLSDAANTLTFDWPMG